MPSTKSRGTAFAIAAYLIWGAFPLYWKQLSAVPAAQLIGHRIVWSFALLAVVLAATRRWREFVASMSTRRLLTYLAAAAFISVNWFVYVWAIAHDLIVEASLGYFINPLLSVVLGVVLFHERLRPLQWLPIGIATTAVGYLAVSLGRLPWIGLILATTFGLYGAVKKAAPLNALFGLTAETGLLSLPGAAYLAFCEINGTGMFLHRPGIENWMMVGGGIVTAVPLLLFAGAATRVALATLGLLQYLTPTIQFLIGVFIYQEPLPAARLAGFALVWIALIFYWGEARLHALRRGSENAQPR